MTADFLLELLSEEIPARMQARARNDLARMFAEELDRAGLKSEGIETFATPRRLALIARGLPLETAAVSEELKGPRTNAPDRAIDGFLKKTGLSREDLVERDGVYFAKIDKPGQATSAVLAEAVERIVGAFPWPKSMRWGAASTNTSSLRWVRPLQGIIALLGEDIVPVAIDGITAGAATIGHRFHHPGTITIGGAHDYVEKLRACHVIVDPEERESIIRDGAREAASAAGLTLVEDEGLVVENAGLTECPVALLGKFDADFLDVPREVIVLTMRTNQKYFACTEKGGALAPAFVCVANIAANDGGTAIVEGNRRVLAARLSDARFFWEHDLKIPLEERAKKLSEIVFHEKLGTVADKVERVAKLARWLVEEGVVNPSPLQGRGNSRAAAKGEGESVAGSRLPLSPALSPEGERGKLADQAERAARLAKADLVTGMVGEFPELQGVIGGYLAAAQGEPTEVAAAIRDHYKPVGQGDEVPTAPVTVAVSLADKLDTMVGFFAIDEKPTGSKDPFALRRAMLGAIELTVENATRVGFRELTAEAYRIFVNQLCDKNVCLARDQLDSEYWSPLLKDRAAYLREAEAILILNAEPPQSAALSNEFGERVWKASEVRRQGLVGSELMGFVDLVNDLTEFMFDRLRDREKREGRRVDIIQAVLPIANRIDLRKLDFGDFGASTDGKRWFKMPNVTANDDTNRILILGSALQAFVETAEGADLLAGYKRAANILKKEQWDAAAASDANVLSDEEALVRALDAAAPKASAAVEAEDFTSAMAALSSLRGPIDAFFDTVTVNDKDAGVRARRLNLLARFRDAVHQVADFSKIEG